MAKQRSHCHVADQDCLNPAGFRTFNGVRTFPARITWECPACGEPTCRNCRKKVKGRTICNNCAEE